LLYAQVEVYISLQRLFSLYQILLFIHFWTMWLCNSSQLLPPPISISPSLTPCLPPCFSASVYTAHISTALALDSQHKDSNCTSSGIW